MHTTQTLDYLRRNKVPYRMSVSNLENQSDEELLALSQKSPNAFEVLMIRYQREFIMRAQAVVKSRDDAEDVVQEAFVRLYRFAPRFRADTGSFKAWAVTILMNVARTRYQKVAKERGVFAKLEDEHYVSLADPVSAHDEYLDKEEVQRVLGAVDADTREILTLAYIEDRPYEEIASLKQTSVGAIKARVHRAKAAVRNALGTQGV
jgi:RNA polymerase sigma-70 factor (ECF subfamily)